MDIIKELATYKSDFITQLKASNNATLANLYTDIITLENAVEVLHRSSVTRDLSEVPQRPNVIPIERKGYSPITRADAALFNLRDAVRDQIKEFGQRSFTTRQMLEALMDKHPDEVDAKRLPSVSATLANLFTGKELRKARDAQNKLTFQSTNWE